MALLDGTIGKLSKEDQHNYVGFGFQDAALPWQSLYVFLLGARISNDRRGCQAEPVFTQ